MATPPPTARLRFREFRVGDESIFHAAVSDPYAAQFFQKLLAESPEEVLARQLGRYERHGHGFWVLERLEDGAHVGDCGITYQRIEGGDVLEVGYHMLPGERGKGYATEAACACIDYAFEALGAETIASIVHVENEPSMTVAGRIHSRRRPTEYEGEPFWLYETSRQEWEAAQPRSSEECEIE